MTIGIAGMGYVGPLVAAGFRGVIRGIETPDLVCL